MKAIHKTTGKVLNLSPYIDPVLKILCYYVDENGLGYCRQDLYFID